jgi:hypothetical protein
MARWNGAKHPRDRYGRFTDGSRGGTLTKVVKGRRSKILSKSPLTTRQTTAYLRAAGVGLRRDTVPRLGLGSGMRRRGQTVRSIERIKKVIVVPTAKVRRSKAVRRRSR